MEGLASGPAIEARWGKKAAELADVEEVWELEADYIAQAVATYILAYSPQKIILWGGVMHQEKLFDMVRSRVKEQLGGYLAHKILEGGLEDYIVPPALGEDPGIKGAIRLGCLAIS
jgi:fructokinase